MKHREIGSYKPRMLDVEIGPDEPRLIEEEIKSYEPRLIEEGIKYYEPPMLDEEIKPYEPRLIEEGIKYYEPPMLDEEIKPYEPRLIEEEIRSYDPRILEEEINRFQARLIEEELETEFIEDEITEQMIVEELETEFKEKEIAEQMITEELEAELIAENTLPSICTKERILDRVREEAYCLNWSIRKADKSVYLCKGNLNSIINEDFSTSIFSLAKDWSENYKNMKIWVSRRKQEIARINTHNTPIDIRVDKTKITISIMFCKLPIEDPEFSVVGFIESVLDVFTRHRQFTEFLW